MCGTRLSLNVGSRISSNLELLKVYDLCKRCGSCVKNVRRIYDVILQYAPVMFFLHVYIHISLYFCQLMVSKSITDCRLVVVVYMQLWVKNVMVR